MKWQIFKQIQLKIPWKPREPIFYTIGYQTFLQITNLAKVAKSMQVIFEEGLYLNESM